MSNLDPDVSHSQLAVPVRIMPSQQKVLEQLHYLTTFHNSLVILAGPDGAGKTTLLELFLEQASDYANLAFLFATPQLTIEQVRQRLFQQIGTLSRTQPNASLSKTIRRALPDEPQHLMVVVDDADLLSLDIVQELQDLVLHSRFTGGKHRISVVVSGTPEWAARQRTELTTSTTDKAEIVLVPELDDQEALAFSKALLQGHEKGRALAMDHTRIFATIGTHLLFPGLIQQQLQALVSPIPATRYQVPDEPAAPDAAPRSQKEGNTTSSSPRQQKGAPSGLKTILVMSLVALCVAAGITAWLHQDKLLATDQAATGPVAEEESDVTEPHPDTPPESSQENVAQQPADSPVVMSYEEALPRFTESAREYTSDREVNLSLIAESKSSVPTEAEATDPVPEEPVVAPSQPTPKEPQNPWLQSHDNAYFLAASAETVVLQLGAVASQTALNRFLDNLGNPAGLKVYHTLKNGRSWYVITTGEYASLAEARQDVPRHSQAIQALEPWAKPIGWIHRELAVVSEQ